MEKAPEAALPELFDSAAQSCSQKARMNASMVSAVFSTPSTPVFTVRS